MAIYKNEKIVDHMEKRRSLCYMSPLKKNSVPSILTGRPPLNQTNTVFVQWLKLRVVHSFGSVELWKVCYKLYMEKLLWVICCTKDAKCLIEITVKHTPFSIFLERNISLFPPIWKTRNPKVGPSVMQIILYMMEKQLCVSIWLAYCFLIEARWNTT